MTDQHLIGFHGGPADGREMRVPALALSSVLWVKTFSDGLVLYLIPREGTVAYCRREGDDTEYEVVA